MISEWLQEFPPNYVLPKYLWAVKGKYAFEAKLSKGTLKYHGYELLENDSQREYVMTFGKNDVR